MKQIYNQLKPLNRFEKILVAITLLSFVALMMLVLDFQFIPNIFNLKPNVIDNINDLINDLSIGIIASFIFYIIVQWFPDRIKLLNNNKLIYDHVKNIHTVLYFILYDYSKNIYDKNVEDLNIKDLKNINDFILFSEMTDSEVINKVFEINSLSSSFKTIKRQVKIIYQLPGAGLIDDDLVFKLNKFINGKFFSYITSTSEFIKSYKMDELKQLNVKFKYDLSDNLIEMYELMIFLKKFTSSSSKQSS
ncbi:hypothetical protein [Empedobacter brevis]|uniref:hypothetical protein n=1 Tax=Empedobacter brevis TaxID=247 RepID=UPI00334195C6